MNRSSSCEILVKQQAKNYPTQLRWNAIRYDEIMSTPFISFLFIPAAHGPLIINNNELVRLYYYNYLVWHLRKRICIYEKFENKQSNGREQKNDRVLIC